MGILDWFRNRDAKAEAESADLRERYSAKLRPEGSYVLDEDGRFAGFVLPSTHSLSKAFLSDSLRKLDGSEIALRIAPTAVSAMAEGVISQEMATVVGVYAHQRDFFMIPTADESALLFCLPKDIHESEDRMTR